MTRAERRGRTGERTTSSRLGIVGRGRTVAIAAALVLAAACAGGYGWTDPAAVGFEPDLGVDLEGMNRTADGLYWEDRKAGTGEVAGVGDTVAIRFHEYLPTGNLLRNTIDGGEPTVFVIGEGRVMAAWELGVPGMREGAMRRIVTPPQLAFAGIGQPPRIPPDQVLVYDIVLEEVR